MKMQPPTVILPEFCRVKYYSKHTTRTHHNGVTYMKFSHILPKIILCWAHQHWLWTHRCVALKIYKTCRNVSHFHENFWFKACEQVRLTVNIPAITFCSMVTQWFSSVQKSINKMINVIKAWIDFKRVQ